MGENIKELLNEEIAAEIQAISSLDSGSEKKSKAIPFEIFVSRYPSGFKGGEYP